MVSFNKNTRGLLALAAAVAMVALVLGLASHQTEALPSLWKGVACAKDYMVRLVKERVISKSTLIREYNSTMATVQQRYEAAEGAGQLAGKDSREKENFYYKLAVEELRNLKGRIESGSIHEEGQSAPVEPEDKQVLEGCYDPDAMVANWNPDEASMDEDDERELLEELDQLEKMARREEEMGWSLSAEAREALASRTKHVLTDLINNEVRQIAMAVISAYLSGGSLAPVLMTLSGAVKYKLADFFMNTILDLVSAAMGRRVEISPAPSEISAPLVPAVAPAPFMPAMAV